MSELTYEELKSLYNRDKDFKDYVDKFIENTSLSLNEVLDFSILKSYGAYVESKKE